MNSPVRAFRGVGGEPLFIRRARGAAIETEDGRRFIDYVGSWGPMILGHADPDVIAAVVRRAQDGLSFGAPTLIETELARRITELVPSIELVRMVSSGTEATMSAIRLARGFTGRERIVKFEGCYHGHSDGLLVKAGSGALTLGVPDSAGVPARDRGRDDDAALQRRRCARGLLRKGGRRNRLRHRRAGRRQHGLRAAGRGLSRLLARALHAPRRGAHLRRSDDGFSRRAWRRAGALWRQTGPHDARQDRRRRHAGRRVRRTARHHGETRTARARLPGGHPVGQPGCDGGGTRDARGRCETGLSRAPRRHDDARLVEGLAGAARAAGIPAATTHVCGMFSLFFTSEAAVTNYRQVMASDAARFRRYFHGMLQAGIYLAPSPFEAGFVSAAHGDAEIAATIEAAGRVSRRDREEPLMRATLAFLAVDFRNPAPRCAARVSRLARGARDAFPSGFSTGLSAASGSSCC